MHITISLDICQFIRASGRLFAKFAERVSDRRAPYADTKSFIRRKSLTNAMSAASRLIAVQPSTLICAYMLATSHGKLAIYMLCYAMLSYLSNIDDAEINTIIYLIDTTNTE